ncbi:hypothetical protein LX99_01612 [Mucilaginibacter oryzae]|uniref:Uncharacterized protein n=1 Tax=Mucilaginibacter oryzae TaxID=468058 RepID=A0A316HF86_9SPHI|nr:hypothetical protein LX99_01612 [Mucilaginibacter oryzae]
MVWRLHRQSRYKREAMLRTRYKRARDGWFGDCIASRVTNAKPCYALVQNEREITFNHVIARYEAIANYSGDLAPMRLLRTSMTF